MDEERELSPSDERGAIEKAKLRLGEPLELTKKLQQTVPLIERLLLGRMPAPAPVGSIGAADGARAGQRGPMTLGHKMILIAAAILPFMPLPIYMYIVLAESGMQTQHVELALAGNLVGESAFVLACYYFVFAAAAPDDRLDWWGTLTRGAIILALQIGLAFFATFRIASRVVTIGEMATCAASTAALVAISGFIARSVGVLRRSYDEWLMLDIAE